MLDTLLCMVSEVTHDCIFSIQNSSPLDTLSSGLREYKVTEKELAGPPNDEHARRTTDNRTQTD